MDKGCKGSVDWKCTVSPPFAYSGLPMFTGSIPATVFLPYRGSLRFTFASRYCIISRLKGFVYPLVFLILNWGQHNAETHAFILGNLHFDAVVPSILPRGAPWGRPPAEQEEFYVAQIGYLHGSDHHLDDLLLLSANQL